LEDSMIGSGGFTFATAVVPWVCLIAVVNASFVPTWHLRDLRGDAVSVCVRVSVSVNLGWNGKNKKMNGFLAGTYGGKSVAERVWDNDVVERDVWQWYTPFLF
jgi:hypothetical protein